MEAKQYRLNAEILDTEVKRLKSLYYGGKTEPAAGHMTITICKNQSCSCRIKKQT